MVINRVKSDFLSLSANQPHKQTFTYNNMLKQNGRMAALADRRQMIFHMLSCDALVK
jgi:hypothetical protein